MASAEGSPLIVPLKEAIRNCGKSLTQLGKAASIDPGQLSRFMRGERHLSMAAVEKLLRVLRGRVTFETREPLVSAKRRKPKA